MNQVILILENEPPKLINVAEGIRSIRQLLPDGSEIEVEIMHTHIRPMHGEPLTYLVATNIDHLSPGEIRQAAESLFQQG